MSIGGGAAADVPLRDAATVLLLRDGRRGLEVFMLRRNLNSDFVGGAYVFPGGAVDPADRADDLGSLCAGRTDADASRRLGIDRGGLAYWVAAIRESFEEAGLLLAYGPDGDVVDLDRPTDVALWSDHRTEVDSGRRRLVEVCASEGLRLAVDGMHYFGHWVTPVGSPRRYDTRFFLAAAPERQTPLHDDREVIDNVWIRPEEGLERAESGELMMLPPTLSSLRAMVRFDSVSDALGAAREIVTVPRVLPKVIAVDGGMRIVLPGDAGYDDERVDAEPDVDWKRVAGQAGTTGFDAVGAP